MRHIFTMAAALVIAAVACAAVSAADPNVEFYNYTTESLFPSALIGTATVDWNDEVQVAEDKKQGGDPAPDEGTLPVYGDENGWLGVIITDLEDTAEVVVELSADEVLKPSKWHGRIKPGHRDVQILPKLSWNFPALLAVREERPLSILVTATVNGKKVFDTPQTVVLTSINECPFYVQREGDEGDDLNVVFAAYVNENHPWIDGVLKDALEIGVVDSFTGYQSGDPAEVVKQVFAVWCALEGRGISYSDVSTSPPNKGVCSQAVRFLEESIEAGQANCVDGSVMLASILRKIGIHSYLVLVPGHCLLAFDLDDDGEEQFGLETTLIGSQSAEAPDELPEVLADLDSEDLDIPYASFCLAVVVGNEKIAENQEGFADGDDPVRQMISVDAAREQGIRPIASGRKRR